mmetsp:Transcript_40865/g.117403  ORF Transcript_40865/g.117403 Transcript_40865/m.117403 type:complete len:267 (-) Transcript_40865:683-1483(-)
MAHLGGRIFGNASSRALMSCSSAGFISGEWKAPPVLITLACKARAFVARSHNFSIVVLLPAQVKPAGNKTLAIWHVASGTPVSALRASPQRRSSVARSRPATEHMHCGTMLVAPCMASARIFTSLRHSSKSRTPAAQIAVYSPRLRPATACKRSTASRFDSRRTSTAASPARNIAGWQYLVSDNFSSGPCKHNSRTSNPRIFCALSSIVRTAGKCIQSFSMPTYWEPCPGNNSATGNGGLDLAGGGGTCDLGMSAFSRTSSSVGKS